MDFRTLRPESCPTRKDLLLLVPAMCTDEARVAAHALKHAVFGDQMHVCAIASAKTGHCGEDCTFCAQSAHHTTEVAHHPLLSEDELVARGEGALALGIRRFSFVTSGGRLGARELNTLAAACRRLSAQGLAVDLSVGQLDHEALTRLRKAGVERIHHNLETSQAFFPQVCTTHEWQGRAETLCRALAAGCGVCAGGIFGVGESWEDRVDLALALRDIGVDSIPLNFLNPIPGTRLEHAPVMEPAEALGIISLFRFAVPRAHIRVAGGRQAVFGDELERIFASGASGVMVGDYLTTPGMTHEHFAAEAKRAGLTVV